MKLSTTQFICYLPSIHLLPVITDSECSMSPLTNDANEWIGVVFWCKSDSIYPDGVCEFWLSTNVSEHFDKEILHHPIDKVFCYPLLYVILDIRNYQTFASILGNSDKTVTNLDLTTKDNVSQDSFQKHIKRFAFIVASSVSL